MKRIANLLIENFQSHLRSELDFSNGLNVIIGPSDNGKSAILRALRWALYNEPRGSDFVRSGARECRVTVTMSDGAQIIREMLLTKSGSPSRNRYIVRIPGEAEQLFEGFGADVPAEVIRAHGMPQVLLDSDKRVVLSFGAQLEGPFLMTESGSFRARAIGRLLGVHVVDAAVRNTQRDLRSVRTEVARLEREVERYDAELLQYQDIPEQEAKLEAAEGLLARVEALQGHLQKLEAINVELLRCEREEILVEAQLGRLSQVAQAETLLRQAEEHHRQGARLDRLAAEFSRMEQESRTYKIRIDALTALPIAEQRAREAAERQARLSGLTRIEGELKLRESELRRASHMVERLAAAPEASDLLTRAAEGIQRLERLQEKEALLVDVQTRLTKGAELVASTEADLQAHLTEYERLLQRFPQCPTCMQPVAPGAIKRIMAELEGS